MPDNHPATKPSGQSSQNASTSGRTDEADTRDLTHPFHDGFTSGDNSPRFGDAMYH